MTSGQAHFMYGDSLGPDYGSEDLLGFKSPKGMTVISWQPTSLSPNLPMAIPTNMTAVEAQNLRRDRQIEQLQKQTELITQQLARLLDEKPRKFKQRNQEDMYYSSDDSSYESDYRSGYNSDNSGQSSLHGKRRVWDDLRDLKEEPPEFHRGTNPDNFIEWLNDIENIFEVKGYSDEKSYKVVVLKFKKYASLWWENVKAKREKDGKAQMKSWRKLKKLLKERFLPDSYKQDLYIKMTNFKQEKQGQTIARYIGGLNHDIAEKLELQPYWTFGL
ncbi:BREVIS RADIX-like domain-containing protein [Tanacetum coccineum]